MVALVLLGLLSGHFWEQLVQTIHFIPNSLNMPKGSIRGSGVWLVVAVVELAEQVSRLQELTLA